MSKTFDSQIWLGREAVLVVSAVFALAASAISGPAAADVSYTYAGNVFDRFSSPSSYTTSDRVTGTLTLAVALPPNLNLENIRGYSGFALTLNDGHQSLTLTPTTPGEALVSTDASGQIVGPWSFIVNCCFYPNNGVSTVSYPGVRGVFDWGILSSPSSSFPNTPLDYGQRIIAPGTWSVAPSTPEALIAALKVSVSSVGPGLSLTNKVDLIAAYYSAGDITSACLMLDDLIKQVGAQSGKKIALTTAQQLIADAQAVGAAIGCN